jgi:signal transduction histidine kinase
MDIFFMLLTWIISISVVLLYLYFFLRYRDLALGLWVLAGFLFVVEFLVDIFFNHIFKNEMPYLIQLLDWYLRIIGSFLILQGTYALLKRKLPRAYSVTLLVVLILKGLDIYYINADWLTKAALFACAVVFAWAGILLIKDQPKRIMTYSTGVILIFWGLNSIYQASQANVTQPTWNSTWGYLFEVILASAGALGFLLLFLEKKRLQDKSIQNFLPYFFHEIKTPLMIIHGYAESIREGKFPEGSLEKSAEAISGEAEQLEKRIKDLLYLEKLDKSSKNPDKQEIIDLAEQINFCVNRFRWRRPEVSWEISIINLFISGRKEQWGVLLDNLIDNQLRYAQSRIRITMDIQKDTQEVILRIWNDGPPIDPELKEAIFTAYQTGAGGNFGLGLAIARRIAENHHGRIWVENEEGGPVFYVITPLIEAQDCQHL